jgi:hypothetical protein
MKNPKNAAFNCWVYEETAALKEALDQIMEGGAASC